MVEEFMHNKMVIVVCWEIGNEENVKHYYLRVYDKLSFWKFEFWGLKRFWGLIEIIIHSLKLMLSHNLMIIIIAWTQGQIEERESLL